MDYERINEEEMQPALSLAEVLTVIFDPASVMDVGCATGLYLKGFLDRGINAIGIDISSQARQMAVIPTECIYPRDVTEPLGGDWGEWDLLLCLETLEHIEERYADIVLDNLCALSDTIVFSAAIPGQGGEGHINCQPKSYWIERFRARGYEPDQSLTDRVLRAVRQRPPWMGWLVQNLVIFVKGETNKMEKQRFRMHLLGLAHVPSNKAISACAYTQKAIKLSRMLLDMGHEVYFYGGEGSDVECTEYIECISAAERTAVYGDYDWNAEFFKHDGRDGAYTLFAERAIGAINARKKDRDFLLVTMGNYQQPIADAVNLMTVESGIGYRGIFAQFKVFESYTWMAYVYGLIKQGDGSWYDCVIPNYFDPADFPFQPEKDDYFLYIGRLVKRKGIEVAVQVTKEIGAKLIVAGQGTLTNATEGINITDPHVEHVGCVGPEERKDLMGRAKAVFVPTTYIEPFGGVAVEAQMCGTPVITTDWGAFVETILPGTTGYRCRTFGEFVWAARNADKINPADCHQWAIDNYSMERVAQQYQAYFEQLYDLWGKGWYELRHTGISKYRRFARV